MKAQRPGLEIYLPLYLEEKKNHAGLVSELDQIKNRGSEVRAKIAAVDQALNRAQLESKAAVTSYALGRSEESAVTLSRNTVRNLDNQLADLKLVIATIDNETARLTKMVDAQADKARSLSESIWGCVVDLELQKAKTYVERAMVAMNLTGYNLSRKVDFISGLSSLAYVPQECSQALYDSLKSEYSIPER